MVYPLFSEPLKAEPLQCMHAFEVFAKKYEKKAVVATRKTCGISAKAIAGCSECSAKRYGAACVLCKLLCCCGMARPGKRVEHAQQQQRLLLTCMEGM